MPSSLPWLGIFNSLLGYLTEEWRYIQENETDLTPAETVEKMQEIIAQFYVNSECDVCLQPSGVPFVRLDQLGQWEELGAEGWGDPTGDYTVYPPPPREGGTPDDQKCLAAKNAANILKEMYEQFTDWVQGGLSNAEIIAAFIVWVAANIASWLAAILVPWILLAGAVFAVIVSIVAYVTSDVWSDEFTDRLACIFLNCATNTDGVVTFDYDCIMNDLASQTGLEPPNFYDLRLFGQIAYIMQIIGIDGLNAAGGTTAITDDDCSFCDDVWCRLSEFDEGLDVWSFFPAGSCSGGTTQPTYLESVPCYVAPATYNYLQIEVDFEPRVITFVEALFDYGRGDFSNYPPNGVQNVKLRLWSEGVMVAESTFGTGSNSAGVYLQYDGEVTADRVTLTGLMCDRATGSNNGYLRLYHMMVAGLGDNPLGETNCEDPT